MYIHLHSLMKLLHNFKLLNVCIDHLFLKIHLNQLHIFEDLKSYCILHKHYDSCCNSSIDLENIFDISHFHQLHIRKSYMISIFLLQFLSRESLNKMLCINHMFYYFYHYQFYPLYNLYKFRHYHHN